MYKMRMDEVDSLTYIEQFKQYLRSKKATNGGDYSFSFKIPKESQEDALIIKFSDAAAQKTKELVRHFSTEVAWHGSVERTSDTEFFIKDIFVYPQKVTGTNVETDQAEYELWLAKLDDEIEGGIETIRMQGHSHVNMGVSPSGTDTTHQLKIAETLGEDDYYIFLIINKKGDVYAKVFDAKTNTVYEDSDITIENYDDEMADFIKEAESIVKTKTFTSVNKNKTAYPNYYTTSGKSIAPTTTLEKKEVASTPSCYFPDEDDFSDIDSLYENTYKGYWNSSFYHSGK